MGSPTANAPPTIGWIKSEDGICEVYANAVHITWSLDDVRIRLAQLVNSPATPNPGPSFVAVAEERAAISLSWRSAKILRDGLTTALAAFEKLNGPIKVDVILPANIP